jgi:hypothetical protein
MTYPNKADSYLQKLIMCLVFPHENVIPKDLVKIFSKFTLIPNFKILF